MVSLHIKEAKKCFGPFGGVIFLECVQVAADQWNILTDFLWGIGFFV